jgi:hypothetical protein
MTLLMTVSIKHACSVEFINVTSVAVVSKIFISIVFVSKLGDFIAKF